MSGAPTARFALVDHFGEAVSEASFANRYLLVYFGFTHCKVVCPRSLRKLSNVLDDLGEAADDITALYITVDPERDSPAVMKAYLEAAHPRFTGLSGTGEQIDQAKKAFRVFAERRSDPDDPDGYVVPHTAIAYLMGRDGAYLDHFSDALDREAVAARIAVALERV